MSQENLSKAFLALVEIMDTLREKREFEELWNSGVAPWLKV
mgnify:CR=1 FL=1